MKSELSMFQRQIELLGTDCQSKIADTVILVAGIGGLGSVVAESLVRFGVQKIYIVDNGLVDAPDLNRQILYTYKDIGRPKVLVAKERLSSINPSCEIVPMDEKISESFELPNDVDGVADCLDNFADRFTLAELAWNKGIFLVHGGINGFWGQITSIVPNKSPKMKDLFAGVDEERQQVQVIMPTSGIVALLQSLEIVKLICGIEPNLIGKLLLIDLLNYDFDKIEV